MKWWFGTDAINKGLLEEVRREGYNQGYSQGYRDCEDIRERLQAMKRQEDDFNHPLNKLARGETV